MESTSISRTPPDDGHMEQWPKRRELSSQQDEDKSPNNYLHHTIPSSTKLRKKTYGYIEKIVLLILGDFIYL